MRASTVLCVISAGLAAAPCLAQTEFYRQNPVTSPGGYSSQDARNPGGLGWFSEVADNFPGTGDTQISQVQFWGGYVTPVGQEGHTHGFSIRFYADGGTGPGTLLFQQDISDFHETVFGTPFGFGQYQYTTDLSPTFAVPSTGTYWISVVAILDRGGSANEPQWGWNSSTNSTPPSAVQRFFSPTFNPVGGDMSFVILGGPNTPACPCDWTHDSVLNSQDFFAFLTDFFNDAADFNQSGSTNSQDFFDFLGCFFGNCGG